MNHIHVQGIDIGKEYIPTKEYTYRNSIQDYTYPEFYIGMYSNSSNINRVPHRTLQTMCHIGMYPPNKCFTNCVLYMNICI